MCPYICRVSECVCRDHMVEYTEIADTLQVCSYTHSHEFAQVYTREAFSLTLTLPLLRTYRSLLQNIVSLIGLFCKRDLSF